MNKLCVLKENNLQEYTFVSIDVVPQIKVSLTVMAARKFLINNLIQLEN